MRTARGLMIVAAIAALGMSTSARAAEAQGAEATCASTKAGSPLAAWTGHIADLKTATGQTGLKGAVIAIGTRTHLSLADSDQVKFAQQPEKTEPAGTGYSGMASFNVPKDGTYRIAAVNGLWIDVAQNGALIKSIAHGHGPDCKGKAVDFPLKAGAATLQLSGGRDAAADILIAPVP